MSNSIVRFTLRFWQELIFLFSVCLLLLEFTKTMILKNQLDNWDILFIVCIVPIACGLSFQFIEFHKKTALALAAMLIIGSLVFVAMSLYYLIHSNGNLAGAIGMLFWAMALLGTSISLPHKYNRIARFNGQ